MYLTQVIHPKISDVFNLRAKKQSNFNCCSFFQSMSNYFRNSWGYPLYPFRSIQVQSTLTYRKSIKYFSSSHQEAQNHRARARSLPSSNVARTLEKCRRVRIKSFKNSVFLRIRHVWQHFWRVKATQLSRVIIHAPLFAYETPRNQMVPL